MSPAEIAASLTEAQREDVLHGKCSVPRNHSDWVSDCICSTFETAALISAGLAYNRRQYPFGLILTPLGLAVREILKGTTDEPR